MERDPAILLYPDHLIGGTYYFTDKQFRQYMMLLFAQHAHDVITNDDVVAICGAPDPLIMKKFIQNPDGTFYNARLKYEMDRRRKFSESRRNNRLKGKDESIDDQRNDDHMKIICSSHDEHVVKKGSAKKLKSIPMDSIQLPWPSDAFAIAWTDWKQYKREQHKFTYKPTGERNALAGLYTETNGNESIAIGAIRLSMFRSWKGIIVEAYIEKNGKTNQSNNSGIGQHVRPSGDYSPDKMQL